MKNFFEHQEQAQHNTRMLMLLMALGVIAMGLAIYVTAVLVEHFMLARYVSQEGNWWLQPELLLASVLGTAAIVAIASTSRLLFLRGGGSRVAEMMGARLVSGSPQDVLEKRFVNVVEEMSIAAGMPVPQAYVLPNESGINAFAAGQTTGDAVVAVTRGCLEKLTREELQGVVAHEMSHITHGDMRINMRMMGVVFGIVCIALLGRLLLRFGTRVHGVRRSNDKDQSTRAVVVVAGLALFLIGSLGELFGKLIKSAIGRQREYLADASAVQYTRNPRGIGGALKKIGGFSLGSVVASTRAEEASHFFFSDIHSHTFGLSGLFATHPPLSDRIARIDPSFKGKMPEVADGIAQPEDVEGVSMLAGGAETLPTSSRLMERVGTLSPQAVATAHNLLADLPSNLRDGASNAFTACAIGYAILWSSEADTRAKQREIVRSAVGEPLLHATEHLLPQVRALPRTQCLALAELLAPGLRAMSAEQRAGFLHVARGLMDADARVTLFEHLIGEVLTAILNERGARPTTRRLRLSAVRGEVQLLLSLLAQAGAATSVDVQRSFQRALEGIPELRLQMLPIVDGQLRGLAHCLASLRAVAPDESARLVDAMARGVMADRQVTEDEAMLVAATCLALEIPVPTWS